MQDLPSARSPSELEKCLALSDFGPGQMWHLESACAVTGEGLDMALDFAKPINTLRHDRRFVKLSFYGIQGPILKWISYFLKSQEQSVLVEGRAPSVDPPGTESHADSY